MTTSPVGLPDEGDILYCPFCGRKLTSLGPGVTIRMTRPIQEGEPLEPHELELLCSRDGCRQRWAVRLLLRAA